MSGAPEDAPAPVRSGGSRTRDALADRIGWSRIRAVLERRRVPRRSLDSYFGGITLFLFLLQVASGILLMLYYVPDAAQAHASVERIVGELPYGRLVRSTHVWAGDLFVGFLLAHLFFVVIRRGYRPPRELAWLGGLLALFVGLGLAFTGTILPWSQSSQAHAWIGSDIAHNVPVVGDALRRFMRGGENVGASTLGHAFGFHVAALPAVLTLLIAAHIGMIALQPRPDADEPHASARIPVYPDFLVRGAALTTAVLILTMTLVVFVDRPLGAAGTIGAAPPAAAHPPWYFLPFHQIVRIAPKEMLGMDGPRFLVGAACFIGLLGALLPFIDRRGSKVTAWIAAALLSILALLSARAID